ncbi:hypothetical protein, partial [Burkholderia stagnalis]|uniref:hypothetical protein n=1 Tax=Burkholderia stagnalis TaxID=1503054 RepID=UPI001C8993F4
LDQFRVQVQALARFNRHFFLAFAWHNVAPWPSVYASHTNIRIGSLDRQQQVGNRPSSRYHIGVLDCRSACSRRRNG